MLLFQFLYATVDILGKGSFIFIDLWILNFQWSSSKDMFQKKREMGQSVIECYSLI